MILSVYEISPAEWMTRQWLYLTWYPMYLCNQTHLTNDITTYVCMKPHPLHARHQRHFTWHHIHCCWQHTFVSMSWHKLCLWHHMYYIGGHPYCVYDYPSSIPDLKHVKTHISSTPYVIIASLWSPHTNSVRYHRCHMYAIIWFIQDMISTLYDNLYNLWHHMHYIHSITCIIYDISSTLYDITYTMCATSHNDHIHGIKQYMFMLYSLDMASGKVLGPQNHFVPSSHYAWHYTQCIFDLTQNVPIFRKEVYVCHHSLYMYDTVCTTYDITSILYDFTPL